MLSRPVVSDCCGASPCNEYEEECGICGQCKEHCNYEEEIDEYDFGVN